MAVKAIILIGGPNRGQRFRPLSFDSPKHLFPVGGESIISHLIESCLKLDQLSEIILLGYYEYTSLSSMRDWRKIVDVCFNKNFDPDRDTRTGPPPISYHEEPAGGMGTAGALYYFRDRINSGNPEAFLVINGDVCGDFDFDLMLAQHRETTQSALKGLIPKPYITVMTTEADRQESLNYGCIVENPENHSIEHYVEKPSTFVSNVINCGAYVCSPELLNLLEVTIRRKYTVDLDCKTYYADDLHYCVALRNCQPNYLSLELDILQQRATQMHCYAYRTTGSWWCQVKTPAAAIYANRQYLVQHRGRSLQFSKQGPRKCQIIGNVYIDPKASVDNSAVIGPNVSIMKNCCIGKGVRIKDSIILLGAMVGDHCLISCSIIGHNCTVRDWIRVEGTPSDPDPDQKFAKVQNPPLFSLDGKLNSSILVLGARVKVPRGTVILNSIVLPEKVITRSYKNEIVL